MKTVMIFQPARFRIRFVGWVASQSVGIYRGAIMDSPGVRLASKFVSFSGTTLCMTRLLRDYHCTMLIILYL